MEFLKKIKDRQIIDKKTEQLFYQMALEEISEGPKRPALWAMALAKSDGDINRAEAVYIGLLAEEYKDDFYLAQREEEQKTKVTQKLRADPVINTKKYETTSEPDTKLKWVAWTIIIIVGLIMVGLVIRQESLQIPVKPADTSPVENTGLSQNVEQEAVQAPQPVQMDPSLIVYGDANIQTLPSIELGEAIKEFMPTQTDILNTGVRWNYQANNPHVIWLDQTYIKDYDYSRKGVMRINVQGKVTKLLTGREYELPWAVIYKSSTDPKFGVETIQFFPAMPESGHRNSSSCFGQEFRDCDFDPLASLAQAGITSTKVCEDLIDGANYTTVYKLSSLNKVSVFAAYSLSTGSGGATADFTLYPNITQDQACSL